MIHLALLGMLLIDLGDMTKGPLTLRPLALTADSFSVAVTLTKTHPPKADYAIVDIFYWVHLRGTQEPALLHRSSAIPVIPGVAVDSDMAPVGANDVAYIDVTLVQRVDKQRFGK